jgi:mono/diheme cytochrome c family protein
MNLFKLLLVVFALAFVYACAPATQQNTVVNNNAAPAAKPTAAAPTPAEVASGKKLYSDNCAACHKETGTGGKMVIEGRKINPDDLTSAKIKGFSDEKIAGYVRNGIEDEGMPAFKDKLTDAQIAELIAYIRSDLQKQ